MIESKWKKLHSLLPWAGLVVLSLAVLSLGRTIGRHGFDELWRALRSFEASDVALAALLACASYLTLTLFDWLCVRTVSSSRIPCSRIARTSFTALSLGHVIGFAAISSASVRYRFYSEYGLRDGEVVGVVLVSASTVAVGLAATGGAPAVLQPDAVAQLAGTSPRVAVAVGAAALSLVAAYVVAAFAAGGSIRLRGRRLAVPSGRFALLQVAAGCANYLLVAGALRVLLGDSTDVGLLPFAAWFSVANSLAIVSHVPGGLGVIEVVVLSAVPGIDAVGALLVFRLVYTLAPGLLGALSLVEFEVTHRRARRRAA